ncbi:class I SAM-dependent methyltransferase [Pseudomonas extremaustralis]|jgi:ubiquinone/menaquinone biosynthesis C-methylase UbiE|uniref:Class I SAM-dependent methyltransferase n=1 Tax=Pseudomonas extremaustralis TaxID=359110 RepID=A0A5C5QMC9_9PSED|nr:class I SAM-dependent methyltransferase [Pseudomonas extremaustralis]EZI29521.1 SAM-dependent methyltransferase [Pseudomonas extremaustralis 14-3 substr. 14-3b]MDB1109865.1 class I SAM-dependent methyltransferase [Pseudomonas extremaustralis]MDF3131316.1 class I SAM-dependent methyltransferase [Pseudomonas extremaustralis]TWS06575.1 class I SAM-dependent methyltransferase [Pseudomonas extremaustralis]SDF44004.1 Methyltransferase domain-containing protein [Pseudomonas extremaustralis]
MSSPPLSSIEIEYAEQCGREHARVCGDTRPPGLRRRLASWRDEWLVRQALKVAGEPGLVLDLACGSGRFWPVLAEHVNRVILASDNSQAMLDHALTHHPASLLKRVKTFQGSAFSIGLSANAVDCIFCLELFRHVPSSEGRLALLREFHRVSRDTVIVSVPSRTPVEAEFRQAGFKVLSYQEFMPGSSQWRVYVLCKRG